MDSERCQGCGACSEACFLGAITLEESDKEKTTPEFLAARVSSLKSQADSLIRKMGSLKSKSR